MGQLYWSSVLLMVSGLALMALGLLGFAPFVALGVVTLLIGAWLAMEFGMRAEQIRFRYLFANLGLMFVAFGGVYVVQHVALM